MDETTFWSMIESAWLTVGGKAKARQQLAAGDLPEEEAQALLESLEEVVGSLGQELGQLSAKDLLAFDRILERKLYDIDRADVQEFTDGSDDGFLYARGFIVVAGKCYYEAVRAKPNVALMDFECEDMCYLSWHLYREEFGEPPASDISRESCSNKEGWPELA